MRRVTPTGEWEVSGWRIRIDEGYKGEGDRRIWVASPGGRYSLLTLSALGAITRLWFDNEDRLYPPERGFEGGERVLRFLGDCCSSTLRDACVTHKLNPPAVRRLDAFDLKDAA